LWFHYTVQIKSSTLMAYHEGVLDNGCAHREGRDREEEDGSSGGCQWKAPALHGMQIWLALFALQCASK
jgi:hypothetical protein